jgi:hypothetical protein
MKKHLKTCVLLESRAYPIGEYNTKFLCSCEYHRNPSYYNRIFREFRVHLDQISEAQRTLFCILFEKCGCSRQTSLYCTRQYHAPYKGTLICSGFPPSAAKSEDSLKYDEKFTKLNQKVLLVVLFVAVAATIKHYFIFSRRVATTVFLALRAQNEI